MKSLPEKGVQNSIIWIGSPAQKTFGETFGAATGVSDPRLQKKSGNWESGKRKAVNHKNHREHKESLINRFLRQGFVVFFVSFVVDLQDICEIISRK